MGMLLRVLLGTRFRQLAALVVLILAVCAGIAGWLYCTRIFSLQPVDGMCWSPDGRRLAVTHPNGYLGVAAVSPYGTLSVTDLQPTPPPPALAKIMSGGAPVWRSGSLPYDDSKGLVFPMYWLMWNHDGTALAVGPRRYVPHLQIWELDARGKGALISSEPMLRGTLKRDVMGWTSDNRLRLFSSQSFREYPAPPYGGGGQEIDFALNVSLVPEYRPSSGNLPTMTLWSPDCSQLVMMNSRQVWLFRPGEPVDPKKKLMISGKATPLCSLGHSRVTPSSIRWSPDGTQLAMIFVYDEDEAKNKGLLASIEVWDAVRREKLQTIALPLGAKDLPLPPVTELLPADAPSCDPELAWSRDGKRLACAFFFMKPRPIPTGSMPPDPDPDSMYAPPQSCTQLWWNASDGSLLAGTFLKSDGVIHSFRWAPDLDKAALAERINVAPYGYTTTKPLVRFTSIRFVPSPAAALGK